MLQKIEPYRRTLVKAAEIIRERGLAVGVLADGEGRVCVAGALNIAATGHLHGDTDANGIAQAYAALEADIGCSAMEWNDRVGDADKVAATLERVALARHRDDGVKAIHEENDDAAEYQMDER